MFEIYDGSAALSKLFYQYKVHSLQVLLDILCGVSVYCYKAERNDNILAFIYHQSLNDYEVLV